MNGYMTVKEYAQKYNLTVQAVYKRITFNKLLVKKIGHLTLVKDK